MDIHQNNDIRKDFILINDQVKVPTIALGFTRSEIDQFVDERNAFYERLTGEKVHLVEMLPGEDANEAVHADAGCVILLTPDLVHRKIMTLPAFSDDGSISLRGGSLLSFEDSWSWSEERLRHLENVKAELEEELAARAVAGA